MQVVAELRAMKLQYGMTKSKPEGDFPIKMINYV